MWVLFDRGHARSITGHGHGDGADSGVEVEHALFGLRGDHVERYSIKHEHLPVVDLHERIAAGAESKTPELDRHGVVEHRQLRQQLGDAAGELIARPPGLAAMKPQPPEQPAGLGFDGEQQVLQALELHLVCRLSERGQRALDAQVVDEATVDREHGVRPHAVEAEPPSFGAGDRLELSADPVAPRLVHAEHRRVGRQAQAGPCPGLLDHLLLEVELIRIVRVLELASSARTEVRARSGRAVRRRLDHARGCGDGNASLAAARLSLHDLARQRVAHEPDLAVVSRHGGAAMRLGGRLEDQRRHSETGSRAGLKPADSTIWVAIRKPSPTLSGWWASLPYCTAWPPSSRHHRTTVRSGQRVWPRVVFTSRTRPVRAAALRMARISAS